MWLNMAANGEVCRGSLGTVIRCTCECVAGVRAGVLQRMFEQLQQEQIVRNKIEVLSLDSTSIRVHPDGTGAL